MANKEVYEETVKTYTTLEKEASAELIEKKSLFIGYAKPVKSDEEALEFVKRFCVFICRIYKLYIKTIKL